MRARLRTGVVVALMGFGGSVAVGPKAAVAESGALQNVAASGHKWAVVLHGGAGVIERKSMSAETDAAYRAALKRSVSCEGERVKLCQSTTVIIVPAKALATSLSANNAFGSNDAGCGSGATSR